jgi:beta-glucuronidase
MLGISALTGQAPGFYTSLIAFQTAGGTMQLFAGILFWLSISLFAQTQATPVIADPASRTTISLDGTWNTIVDPYESGIPSRYYQPPQPKNKSELIEFDFDHSPKLHVPGDWNTQRDSLLLYEGPLWYQRQFSYAKKPHTRVFCI